MTLDELKIKAKELGIERWHVKGAPRLRKEIELVEERGRCVLDSVEVTVDWDQNKEVNDLEKSRVALIQQSREGIDLAESVVDRTVVQTESVVREEMPMEGTCQVWVEDPQVLSESQMNALREQIAAEERAKVLEELRLKGDEGCQVPEEFQGKSLPVEDNGKCERVFMQRNGGTETYYALKSEVPHYEQMGWAK